MKSLSTRITESFNVEPINEAFASDIITNLIKQNPENLEIVRSTFTKGFTVLPLDKLRDSKEVEVGDAASVIRKLEVKQNSNELRIIILTNPNTNLITAIAQSGWDDMYNKSYVKLIKSSAKSNKSAEERLEGAMNSGKVKAYALVADAQDVERFRNNKSDRYKNRAAVDPLVAASIKRKRDLADKKAKSDSKRNAVLKPGSHPDMKEDNYSWSFPNFRFTLRDHKMFAKLYKTKDGGDINISIEVGEPKTGFYIGSVEVTLDYDMKIQHIDKSNTSNFKVDVRTIEPALQKIIDSKGWYFGDSTAV